MNGQKAKAIRKEVYGDKSKRNPRQYVKDGTGAIMCAPSSLRAKYKAVKKEVNR